MNVYLLRKTENLNSITTANTKIDKNQNRLNVILNL